MPFWFEGRVAKEETGEEERMVVVGVVVVVLWGGDLLDGFPQGPTGDITCTRGVRRVGWAALLGEGSSGGGGVRVAAAAAANADGGCTRVSRIARSRRCRCRRYTELLDDISEEEDGSWSCTNEDKRRSRPGRRGFRKEEAIYNLSEAKEMRGAGRVVVVLEGSDREEPEGERGGGVERRASEKPTDGTFKAVVVEVVSVLFSSSRRCSPHWPSSDFPSLPSRAASCSVW